MSRVPVFFCVLLVAAGSLAGPTGDGTSEIVPVELSGRIVLGAPAVTPPLVQGTFDARSSLVGGTVEARSLEELDGAVLTADSSSLTSLVAGGGAAPSETGASFVLSAPSYGAGFAVRAELRLGLGQGEDRFWVSPVATDCTTRCQIDRPDNRDLGCSPSCPACPPGCNPPLPLTGVDLVEGVAFVELRFTAACLSTPLNPSAASVGAWVDDGDGLLDKALDVLRAATAFTNPDTELPGNAPAGQTRIEARFAVPSGVPLILAGEARFGLPRRSILITADPRTGGALLLQPGELLVVTDPTPVSAAEMPPSVIVSPPVPRECDPPPVGTLAGSFDIRDEVCDSIDRLLDFSTSLADGPSPGVLALVSPSDIPPPGLQRGSGPFIDRFEIRDLLPNGRASQQLPDLEGDYYHQEPLVFLLNRAKGKRAVHRGTATGLEAAASLLSNDPPVDLAGSCGLDPLDPDVAAIQALAPLVEAYNDAPALGMEALNGNAYRTCPTEGLPAGQAPAEAAFRDGIRVLKDPPDNASELPVFATELRAGLYKGVLRIIDGLVDEQGDVTELGIEGMVSLGGFGDGEDPSFVAARGARPGFETTPGTTADALPQWLDLGNPGGGRYPLRLPPGAPLDADGVREFFGMPSLFELASLSDSEILAFPFPVPPDLGVPENRDAYDRSETHLHYGQVVGLGLNVPGPVANRRFSVQVRFGTFDGNLLDGRFDLVDVTKPSTRGNHLDGSATTGAMPASFPGPDFPSIVFPLDLLRDVDDRRRDGSVVTIPAGTILDTAIDGSRLFFDPPVTDGSDRFGEAYVANDLDATVDTEPTPDPNPDDNDAILDRVTVRSPRLVKPDEPPSTRSTLLDRATLEPEELTVENFGVCVGTVRIILKAARRSTLTDPVVRGRGFLNAALLPDLDGDGDPDPISSVRPDLGLDLNEDGVDDQYLVFLDEQGFAGTPTRAEGFGRNGSVSLVLPVGDYLLEPEAWVRVGGDPQTETLASFSPVEVSVTCGGEIVVNAGEPACPLTQGFWKRQCKGPHPSGENANLPSYVAYVNAFATFADVSDESELCDRLHPDPPNDKCEQAEAQFMALLLNLASGRVPETATVSPRGAQATTALELAEDIDAILANPARTFEDCVLAQSLAAEFNEGSSLPGSGECPGEIPPPAIGNSLKLARVAPGQARVRWNNLPRSRARAYELVGFERRPGIPPTGRLLDMLGEVFDAGPDGTSGVVWPLPPAQIYFVRVRGLSPVFEYPGSLGP